MARIPSPKSLKTKKNIEMFRRASLYASPKRSIAKIENNHDVIDEKTLKKVLSSIPENVIFDISDASGNSLFAPSRVDKAVKILIKRGAVVCADKNNQCMDMNSTYRLTSEGIELKSRIAKESNNGSNGYCI